MSSIYNEIVNFDEGGWKFSYWEVYRSNLQAVFLFVPRPGIEVVSASILGMYALKWGCLEIAGLSVFDHIKYGGAYVSWRLSEVLSFFDAYRVSLDRHLKEM